jgi:hypothetical protein
MKQNQQTVSNDKEIVAQPRSRKEYLGTMLGQLLGIELALFVLGLVSFLFTGNLNWLTLSDRLFWMAMIPIALGAIGIIAVISAGANFKPGSTFKPEQAQFLMANFVKSQRSADARYDFCILMWVAGMVGIGISALVQMVSTIF